MANPHLVTTPCLKRGCTATQPSPGLVRIQNAVADVVFERPARVPDAALATLNARPTDAARFARALGAVVDENEADLWATIDQLVKVGVVVEHPDCRPAVYGGEYVAHRLIDTFRETAPIAWASNPLCDALTTPGNRPLAVGFLLETYFHMRAAGWTSTPALGHSLTARQRAAVEDFFVGERGHAEGVVEGFRDVGLDPAEVRAAAAAPETELLERFFFSCGHRSIAEFATALIVPEVSEEPAGVTTDDGRESMPSMVDLVEKVQGVPSSLTARFREHEHVNDELDHGSLPVVLLGECGAFTRPQVESLFDTLHQMIGAYQVYFMGILRRHRDAAAPLRRRAGDVY